MPTQFSHKCGEIYTLLRFFAPFIACPFCGPEWLLSTLLTPPCMTWSRRDWRLLFLMLLPPQAGEGGGSRAPQTISQRFCALCWTRAQRRGMLLPLRGVDMSDR